MLKVKMYVRCPADKESVQDPRIFVCGQITRIDNFKQTAKVRIHDPFGSQIFFEDLPKGGIELPLEALTHCSLFLKSEVLVNGEICVILSEQKSKDGYFHYYVQNADNKKVFRVCETDIVAAFNNGRVDPANQLKNYEFQNPCWYFGHNVVSRSMNILDNSMHGFKDLAGSKIYLLPHQVNTIMRCLQSNPCRFMLADEVGMGKTIEAISILKIFLQNRSYTRVLIIVPDALKEQWKSELLLKFNISIGSIKDNNSIFISSFTEMNEELALRKWDFVIVDEVHRCITDRYKYDVLHALSCNSENILLLSATPVQQRKEEYLNLLRLLQPSKYDAYELDEFSALVEKQGKIIQKTALILDDLGDLEEEIHDLLDSGNDPHDSEDCEEFFEEIFEKLEDVCNAINDEKLFSLLEKIDFDKDDLSLSDIKVIIAFICSNYQLESNIIRNRRRILEIGDEEERLLPIRQLMQISYSLDASKNIHETVCYHEISDWISENVEALDVLEVVAPMLCAMFSSAAALTIELRKLKNSGIVVPRKVESAADKWLQSENHILDNIQNIIDDPYDNEEYLNTRMVTVVNLLYEELFDQKVVLFTNYSDTFNLYRKVLAKVFADEEISFFGQGLSAEEMELNAYRFQNDAECRIMLCDYTGGEGRNFQCADYVVHIDLPWDANMIEQRIGRLDRLERDKSRPIVKSVVVYAEDTFEEALFKFWSDGLKIFTQSLSGMEIIMNDINNEIVSSVRDDFNYGLFNRIPEIIKITESMREIIRKEQNYDAAGFLYRPMYTELKRLIDYYAHNENELFATTMCNWATLAGFRGIGSKNGTITYMASSFSPKSAIKAQLIPPKWNEYINLEQNKFVSNVQHAYEKEKAIKSTNGSIRGTFIRKNAIENDYLHFYAPGDAVFDCIVNNAMLSCKGTSSAFAIPAEYNWKGFIFTWSFAPNESILLDNKVPLHALNMYRNFLLSEQVVVPIGIENDSGVSDEDVKRAFIQCINAGFNKGHTVHLGKRSRGAAFLKDVITSGSNIDWFKGEYPEGVWAEMVDDARENAKNKAVEQLKKRSNIRGAREEIERTISARIANAEYYGLCDDGVDQLRSELNIILEALRKPRVILDSVAYVWMVKKENGESQY